MDYTQQFQDMAIIMERMIKKMPSASLDVRRHIKPTTRPPTPEADLEALPEYEKLDTLSLRPFYLRSDMIARLHFLRHLEVSLSAAWFGRAGFTIDEQHVARNTPGGNAGARLVRFNHDRHSDELWVNFDLLAEMVARAVQLSFIKVVVDVSKDEDIPRLLTVDFNKFTSITARMKTEAGWSGVTENVPGSHILSEYHKTG